MKKTTVRESFLTDEAYKIVGYILVVGIIVTVTLPLVGVAKISYWLTDVCFFLLMAWFTTFFQRHSLNWVLSLIIGATVSLIISIALTIYISLIG